MKRKVMRIADTTYVVSLPLKWVRQNNIQKGQEVDLEPEAGKLILNFTAQQPAQKRFEVDVGELSKVPDRYVTALYRKGIGELTIRYSNPATIRSIQACLSEQTIGMEIINQKTDFCTIRDLSGHQGEEYSVILRRIWLLIKEIAEDSLKAAQAKDHATLKNMFYRDRAINKFSNYCCRILLNTSTISEYERIITFHFIRNLEDLADNYKNLCLYCDRKEPNLSKRVIEAFKGTNALFESFYNLFYSYSDKALEKIILDTEELKDKLEVIFDDETKDQATPSHLLGVVQGISNLLSTVFEINIHKIEESKNPARNTSS